MSSQKDPTEEYKPPVRWSEFNELDEYPYEWADHGAPMSHAEFWKAKEADTREEYREIWESLWEERYEELEEMYDERAREASQRRYQRQFED